MNLASVITGFMQKVDLALLWHGTENKIKKFKDSVID